MPCQLSMDPCNIGALKWERERAHKRECKLACKCRSCDQAVAGLADLNPHDATAAIPQPAADPQAVAAAQDIAAIHHTPQGVLQRAAAERADRLHEKESSDDKPETQKEAFDDEDEEEPPEDSNDEADSPAQPSPAQLAVLTEDDEDDDDEEEDSLENDDNGRIDDHANPFVHPQSKLQKWATSP